jgi:hypothetical protein
MEESGAWRRGNTGLRLRLRLMMMWRWDVEADGVVVPSAAFPSATWTSTPSHVWPLVPSTSRNTEYRTHHEARHDIAFPPPPPPRIQAHFRRPRQDPHNCNSRSQPKSDPKELLPRVLKGGRRGVVNGSQGWLGKCLYVCMCVCTMYYVLCSQRTS